MLYMRHSSLVIEEVVRMRVGGQTLGEIVSKTGLSKTTVFHHIQKLPKSSLLHDRLKVVAIANQKINADNRRGKTLKKYSFKKPERWDPGFVKLMAHFLFDGQLSKSWCGYNSRNSILIKTVTDGMKIHLNVDDYKTYFNNKTGVTRVAYHNVEVADFIRGKIDELLKYIPTEPLKNKISFLKAFFDDEGCITFKNGERAVRGYQHSSKILKIIKQLLSDIGVESKIDEKYSEINIGRKENIIKFKKLINFTPGIKVNGNRSNSIWKKHLEKREILKMAIDSYLN